jgi:hypothetical protein
MLSQYLGLYYEDTLNQRLGRRLIRSEPLNMGFDLN